MTKYNFAYVAECLLDIVFLMDFSDGASDKRQAYIDLVSTLIRELDLGQTLAQVLFEISTKHWLAGSIFCQK